MTLSNFTKDVKASVVVFLVALPLCLGISLASGAPLISGILSGIIGGLVVSAISDSRTSVTGPAAGLTVIVFSAIDELGSFQAFALAVTLSGLFQILFGLLKAGDFGGFFPNSVIKGMLAAIGLILILKQAPYLKGGELFSQGAVVISVISIFLLLAWERVASKGIKFFQLFPAALAVVLVGIVLGQQFQMDPSHFVSLPVGKELWADFNLPDWTAFTNPIVLKVAITLALVGSLETLLSIEAVDKLDPHKQITNKNRELLAQGFGNGLAGLLGALPMTAVIVRSSANLNAGNHSRLSAWLHGLWLLLAVALIPNLLQLVPLASLASILIMVGFKLCHPKLFKEMASMGRSQLVPFVVTVGAIMATDLLMGIAIGLLVGFGFVVKSLSSKSIVVTNIGQDYLIRFMKDVTFLHKPSMKRVLDQIPHGASVVIDGSNHYYVDNDIVLIIQDFIEVCDERCIKCEILRSSLAMNEFFKELPDGKDKTAAA